MTAWVHQFLKFGNAKVGASLNGSRQNKTPTSSSTIVLLHVDEIIRTIPTLHMHIIRLGISTKIALQHGICSHGDQVTRLIYTLQCIKMKELSELNSLVSHHEFV